MEGSQVERGVDVEEQTPGVQVRQGFTQLAHWASRPDVRRYLYGSADNKLSPADAGLLEFLTSSGPMRISDLAAVQGVDKSTMTPQVRRLEERGFVIRELDPTDRRAMLVRTSPTGVEVQQRIGQAGAEVLDDVLSSWSKEDREALGSLMVRFANQLARHRSLDDATPGAPATPTQEQDHAHP
ncbi:MarR family winged helix-turn-helix transcriptional regulator [Arthrobacter sp. B1805]|uniref:MarR family winged helix-turn-helix transcriptional regulator n=1 Tax=Arthrobacter sp. B1805 TaxID=2058892 RepID=UPI000CE2FAB7|nr:MarR family transcriptional regulator [Arthrobacter sp. B1805]